MIWFRLFCLFFLMSSFVMASDLSSQERMSTYLKERRDPFSALLHGLFIPGLGHRYIHQGDIGDLFMYSELSSLGLAGYFYLMDSTHESDVVGSIFLIVFSGLKLWECLDVFDRAEQHNYRLRQKYHIELDPYSPSGYRVSFLQSNFGL